MQTAPDAEVLLKRSGPDVRKAIFLLDNSIPFSYNHAVAFRGMV